MRKPDCVGRWVWALMLLFPACPLTAQNQPSPVVWQPVEAAAANVPERERWVRPVKSRAFNLDSTALAGALNRAPREFSPAAAQAAEEVVLPMPDGTFARFQVTESPIMAPELAAKFPEIKTYSGQGIDDPSATIRFDLTPAGFHAQILSPRGAVYIDPARRGDARLHLSYYRRDLARGADGLQCLTPEDAMPRFLPAGGSVRSGAALRTFRLAVAATGEYTAYHGGTAAAGMAAIVTAINRVNGIYESELAVRMVLVANNDALVYTNAATDPFANNSASAMLGQNQTTIDSVIGDANYDVGHVFSTGGGGLSGVGIICETGDKARTVTGLPDPVADAFYVDYVAHEAGHAFGAMHTFNGVDGSCGPNRSSSTAYERGSGTTIMAYSGICLTDDVQEFADPFFHSASVDQIQATVSGSCAVSTPTGNSAPIVSAGADYVIPQSTQFILTAIGSDPNGDAVTYCWEERDLGPAQALNAGDNGSSPLFRAYPPTNSPTRIVPRNPNPVFPAVEKFPTTSRAVKFRVTARDSRIGAGGVAVDDMQITVVGTAGPFRMTNPPASLSGTAALTWDVAGTTAAPINAATVNILLSTDSGVSYSIILATNTPNDGAESVLLPNISTTTARIRIQASGNIFFDDTDQDLTITPFIPTPNVVFNNSTLVAEDCAPGNSRMDPGEVVTFDFALKNSGTAGSGSVTATLLASPGIVPLSGQQDYGVLAAGASVAKPFQFLATGACGGTVTATLQLQEDANPPTTATVKLGFGESTSFTNLFANTASISIPDRNAAFPYPAPIVVSGLTNPVAKVIVTITNLIHASPRDIDILLVSPGGRAVLLMSDAGGSGSVTNVTLRFDDDAAGSLADSGTLASGIYKPTNFGNDEYFSAPAPAAPYATTLSAFEGQSASGTWALYVYDDTATNSGRIAVGWRLTLVTQFTTPCCAGVALPELAIADATVVESNSGLTNARFAVSLSRPVGQTVTVSYATADGSALAGADYAATAGALQFGPGQTNQDVNVSVPGDTLFEGNKNFTVSLSQPVNATLGRASATGTIFDDEIRVSAATLSGAGVRLDFNTLAGRNYRVERCPSLSTTNLWTVVPGASLVPGTGGVVQILDADAVGQPQLFYRVQQIP